MLVIDTFNDWSSIDNVIVKSNIVLSVIGYNFPQNICVLDYSLRSIVDFVIYYFYKIQNFRKYVVTHEPLVDSYVSLSFVNVTVQLGPFLGNCFYCQ